MYVETDFHVSATTPVRNDTIAKHEKARTNYSFTSHGGISEKKFWDEDTCTVTLLCMRRGRFLLRDMKKMCGP